MRKHAAIWIGSIAIFLLVNGFGFLSSFFNLTAEAFNRTMGQPAKASHLLITEISPNNAGADSYEFFELHNPTDAPIDLSQFTFIYQYTKTPASDKEIPIPDQVIDPGKSAVLWFNNGGKTAEDFNKQYGVRLTADELIPFTEGFAGFYNGGDRGLLIKDGDDSVVSASYTMDDISDAGLDVHFRAPESGTAMKTYKRLAAPTPGAIDEEQALKETKSDSVPPEIKHEPVSGGKAFSPVPVQAEVTDDQKVAQVQLHYKRTDQSDFSTVPMKASQGSPAEYKGEIPGMEAVSDMTYYIEASDGQNTEKTKEFPVAIEPVKGKPKNVPPLLITEAVPNSSNTGAADGYEFIEVYNNTNEDVNFKNYKLQYRSGAEAATDVVWPSIPDDVVIPSGKTLTFWIINSSNGDKTTADFNRNYGSSLKENEELVKVYSDGMSNTLMRGLVVATNAGREVNVAYYNDVPNVLDPVTDKGINYTFPQDGSKTQLKVNAGKEAATPGKVSSYQVPSTPVQIKDDQENPAIEDLTKRTETDELKDFKITAEALDDQEVKSVKLYVRTDSGEFKEKIIKQDYNDTLFHHTVYSPDLIGKKSLEYYFVVSDGKNEIETGPVTVKITSTLDSSPLRMNLKEGEFAAGERVLRTAPRGGQLLLDGNPFAAKAAPSLEHEAYFAFEVNNVNTFFQNGITMGDDVLRIFDDFIMNWQTIYVPVDPSRLKAGDNVITVRSGTKATPFDMDSLENRDDFDMKHPRLILRDGTIIHDPAHPDPDQNVNIGDGAGGSKMMDFHFDLKDEHLQASSYIWNTGEVKDGKHQLTVKYEKQSFTRNVIVDNTAPEIKPNIIEGKEYKGSFKLDARVKDKLSGISKTEVKLDGKIIELPQKASASKMEPGDHTLYIKAADKAGNAAEQTIRFETAAENPNQPRLISPKMNEKGKSDPILTVQASDPTGDDLTVSFLKGFRYDASLKGQVNAYKNTAETEPPATQVPEGEKAFTDQERALTEKNDNQYVTTDSSTEFPYHRFDVKVDSSVDENDRIELSWEGHSLEGRKVTMYAWNHSISHWSVIDGTIAGKEDFELKGEAAAADFVKDSKINVMIQDEIPASSDDYDYTFVWISDTQYYSETYPHIYDSQTKWIADKKEEMKIKYVFHTGDLVNMANQDYQWKAADQYMKTLEDANVPYGVLAGNHDVDHKTSDYSQYWKYFGENRFKDQPHYGESYQNNKGHYDLISANGNDYIMVYMGWGVDDESIAWMNKVLSEHPDRKAILNFHEYLMATGTRHPLGEKLFQEIVVPNQNVIAVLSGHYHESRVYTDEIDDNGDGKPDRSVPQILADYQSGPEGGQGYMRLLHFDADDNRIIVNTYSPYLNDYNFYNPEDFPNKDEFTLNLDLSPMEKRVATDYFAVNIFTDERIGKKQKIKSGGMASVKWNGLRAGSEYSWYAEVRDRYTGRTISDIWSFKKK
ncbi:lamin tail domain-containing protein [Metabacillus sp. 113a]|uniref:lamin tail domain-containing protein n=1 Tax=Metabacillus sp. 113a TaxID=3404706 RepID=UPI003CF13F25